MEVFLWQTEVVVVESQLLRGPALIGFLRPELLAKASTTILFEKKYTASNLLLGPKIGKVKNKLGALVIEYIFF